MAESDNMKRSEVTKFILSDDIELTIFTKGGGSFYFNVFLTRVEAKRLRKQLKEALNDES